MFIPNFVIEKCFAIQNWLLTSLENIETNSQASLRQRWKVSGTVMDCQYQALIINEVSSGVKLVK